MIVTLSDALLDRSRFPQSGVRNYHDRVLSGFMVRIGPRTKTFYIQTTCKSRQIKHAIGRYPMISTADARAQALRLLQNIRNGIPPVKARERFKEIPTLAEVLEHYLCAKQLKPKTVKAYRSIIRIHFCEYAEKPMPTISEQHFAQHWETLLRTLGASVANTCRAVINALISYASVVFGLTLTNHVRRLAAAGLKPRPVKSRDALVEDKDQPRWYAAIVTTQQQYCVYLLLVALTGIRLREGINIHWEDIDLEAATLYVRSTKNDKPYTIPIGLRLCALLQHYRQTRADTCGPIFDAVSHNHAATTAVRRGAPEFNIHDLRRGFVTTGAKLGLSDRVIKRLVNHSAKDVTGKHYIVLSVEDIRPAMQLIEDRLTELWCASARSYADDFNEQRLKCGRRGKSELLQTPPN